MMSEARVDHSALPEPSRCQSRGVGLGAYTGLLLWMAAMETESWDIWLMYSSRADVASPDSARNTRTPVQKTQKNDN